MERPKELSKIKPGEHYIYRFLDENGEREQTPWGLPIPDLKINCVKYDEISKYLRWDYISFIDFIFESLESGVTTEHFDNWMWEKTGVRSYILKPVQSREERYKKLLELRLKVMRNAVLGISELEFKNKRADNVDVQLGRFRHNAKFAVLARLDPDFKETINQNITGNIAQIILPEKNKDEI
jgi:hypothetical protein